MDVEGSEIVPWNHIQGCRTSAAPLVQSPYKQVDIRHNGGLLVPPAFLAETRLERAPDDIAFLKVNRGKVFLGDRVEAGISPQVLLLAVDVVPGRGVGKGQLVRRDPHHLAVAPVQVQDIVRKGASYLLVEVWEYRGSHMDRPGEVAERMDAKVVNNSGHRKQHHLACLISGGLLEKKSTITVRIVWREYRTMPTDAARALPKLEMIMAIMSRRGGRYVDSTIMGNELTSLAGTVTP